MVILTVQVFIWAYVTAVVNYTDIHGLLSVSKNESAGIAASIDAMAAGEDAAEVSGNGSKNSAEDSPAVCYVLFISFVNTDAVLMIMKFKSNVISSLFT